MHQKRIRSGIRERSPIAFGGDCEVPRRPNQRHTPRQALVPQKERQWEIRSSSPFQGLGARAGRIRTVLNRQPRTTINIPPQSGGYFRFGHSPNTTGNAQVRFLLACQPRIGLLATRKRVSGIVKTYLITFSIHL